MYRPYILSLTILIAFSFSLVSCSTKPNYKVPNKRYSHEVEREFQDIEYDRKRVLNYYRNLRKKNWEEYKHNANQISRYRYTPERHSNKRTGMRVVPSAPRPKPKKTQLSLNKVEQMNIEIRQNLSYYCMKNRKSGKFSNRSECLDFTQNIFKKCKEKYPVYRDRSPVNCIKNKLR